MNLLIKNIKCLCGIRNPDIKKIRGSEMKTLPSIENAFLLIENGLIKDFGEMNTFNSAITKPQSAIEVDASGKFVFPTWCDSHTHVVYASSREAEFVDRITGLSYEEIAKRGGGLLNSTKKLEEATEEE